MKDTPKTYLADLKKKQPKFIKEFSDFINRGNVLDLAVGVIIGGAFSKIVSSLVDNIITPFIGIMIGGVNFSGLELTVPNFFGNNTAAVVKYGLFLQNIFDFLVVALCIFIFIKLINKLNNKKATEKPTKKTQEARIVELLEKIEKKIK